MSLSAEMDRVLQDPGIPGIGTCTIRDRRIQDIVTLGERKAGTGNLLSIGDRFHIGSCTKFMTTCLVQMTVDTGRLSWDDNLASLGKLLRTPVDPALESIPLDELLTCTAGFPEDRNAEHRKELLEQLREFNGDPRAGRRRLAESLLAGAEDVKRDGEYRYSNFGYCLLGALLDSAWNHPYEDLLKEMLFSPLEMRSAAFGPPVWIDRNNEPWGHLDGAPVESVDEAENPLALAPAGTVCMNLEDMGRYLLFVMGETDVLPYARIQRLMEPATPGGFARGWIKDEDAWSNGPFWLTSGSNGTFLTVFLVAPGVDAAVAVSANAGDDGATRACQAIVETFVDGFRAA